MSSKLLFSLNAKHFSWDYFTASGPGGQHRNKVATACRCKHEPSGAVATSTEFKSQLQNKQAAFKKCCESDKFQKWCRMEASRILGKPSVDEIVDEMMSFSSDFKIEIKDEKGKWKEISLEEFLLTSA